MFLWYMLIAIVCGTLGILILVALVKFAKEQNEKFSEPPSPEADPVLLSVLRDDFRAIRMANPGASVDLLNLSTMIQKLDRGDGVETSTVLFLLSRLKGTEGTIKKIKGEGA